MNKILIFGAVFIFLFGIVSSVSVVGYYYSPTCPHCQKVSPVVNDLYKKYPNVQWNFYDVSTGQYNVGGVPQLIIDDVTLSGSYEIPRYAECYLAEQSNLNCITKSADTSTMDWFIR